MKIISISDEYLERFAAGDREFMQKHGRPCQTYLNRYEVHGRPKYAVDIDRLIKLLDQE